MSAATHHELDELEEDLRRAPEEEGLDDEPDYFDEFSQDFVDTLVAKTLVFTEELVGHHFFRYQRRVASRLIESIIIGDGDTITFLCARQAGKALALDTPILTTSGWKTMGTVEVGDEVYAPDGTATRVEVTSEVFEGHDCFRVEFKDGQTITADADHRWTVWDRLKREEVTVDTRELAATWEGTDDRFRYRYAVETPEPLEAKEAELPLDPYLFGVWLGDGSSYKAEITTMDSYVVEELQRHYKTSYEYPTGKATTYGVLGLQPTLKALGLLGRGAKHVPEVYALASFDQRLALLQGMMDSDGYGGPRGHCEFTSTNPRLAEDVLFLARSLGWKATIREGRSTFEGKDCGPKWRVTWAANASEPPFRLERKSQNLPERSPDEWRRRRTGSIAITGVVPVESVPTRCLGVEHPRHLFLAGKGLIPTHNTETVANVIAAMMILLPRLAKLYPNLLDKFKNGVMVGCFAPTEDQAETMYGRIVDRLTSERAVEIMLDPEIDDKPDGSGGFLKLTKSGSLVRMRTANPKAKVESKTYHILVGDESQDIDEYMWNKSISPMGAFYNATSVMTGTPTTHKGVFFKNIQLNKRRDTRRGARQNHFEFTWKHCARENDNYAKFVRKEMLRLGEDSDEFQMSYCVAPETRILTADLRYIEAREVVPGMDLAGFDEERPSKGAHRRFKNSTVEDVGVISRPCYRVVLSDGTEVVSSSEHQWLVSTAGRRTVWKTTESLRVGSDRIFRLADTWDHEEDYATGYLAAAFDGEGSLCNPSVGAWQLNFTQRENEMLAKVREFLDLKGFKYWETYGGGSNENVTTINIAGGRAAVMRFLGSVRPERLIGKVDLDCWGSIGRHDHVSQEFSHPEVVSVEYLGEREVVAIRTTSRTYIAEGLASHNCLRWLLDRGMFTTSTRLDELGDKSMKVVKSYFRTPVVVGIDPARSVDSTVVTVCFVNWAYTDEFGYYDHRILNWLELQGTDWEEQYFLVHRFLSNYAVAMIGIDGQGVGDAFVSRMRSLMPQTEIEAIPSDPSSQTKRWLHLEQLFGRGLISWPAHAETRRLRVWKRFYQQMEDLEKVHKGKHVMAEAPNERDAHDDYADSLALATILTKDFTMPQVEVTESPFVSHRRR